MGVKDFNVVSEGSEWEDGEDFMREVSPAR
jgi:hypothetical protein